MVLCHDLLFLIVMFVFYVSLTFYYGILPCFISFSYRFSLVIFEIYCLVLCFFLAQIYQESMRSWYNLAIEYYKNYIISFSILFLSICRTCLEHNYILITTLYLYMEREIQIKKYFSFYLNISSTQYVNLR